MNMTSDELGQKCEHGRNEQAMKQTDDGNSVKLEISGNKTTQHIHIAHILSARITLKLLFETIFNLWCDYLVKGLRFPLIKPFVFHFVYLDEYVCRVRVAFFLFILQK